MIETPLDNQDVEALNEEMIYLLNYFGPSIKQKVIRFNI